MEVDRERGKELWEGRDGGMYYFPVLPKGQRFEEELAASGLFDFRNRILTSVLSLSRVSWAILSPALMSTRSSVAFVRRHLTPRGSSERGTVSARAVASNCGSELTWIDDVRGAVHTSRCQTGSRVQPDVVAGRRTHSNPGVDREGSPRVDVSVSRAEDVVADGRSSGRGAVGVHDEGERVVVVVGGVAAAVLGEFWRSVRRKEEEADVTVETSQPVAQVPPPPASSPLGRGGGHHCGERDAVSVRSSRVRALARRPA